MSKIVVAIMLAAAAQVCIAAEATTADPYAEGVQAYRAKDYVLARQKWEQALDSLHGSSAQNNLGYLLFYGLGGAADPQRAILYWAAAATAGHAEAQWHLGNTFEDGVAVRQDKAKGYAWYRCSIANGERRSFAGDSTIEQKIAADARASLARVRVKLTEGELRRGEMLANECIDSNFEDLFVGIERVKTKGVAR